MGSGFQNPITIKEAIDKIHSRQYLLPAIQRKFTWSSNQIEMLFDSILRGYPINSFMLWKITDGDIKRDYKFYEFLTAYREFFAENNNDIDTKGVPDFEAVIDGQQRLTSLYIGLRGTYAYKMPRKWWKDTEECLPTRKLYLNLGTPVQQQYDNQKTYDFRFLSAEDLDKFSKSKEDYYWFEVGEILGLDDNKKIMRYLSSHQLNENSYAFDTLSDLYEAIHVKPLINYYLQEEQEPDKVLDIFIRTNSGGTPLSFSDLLMSIASANWKNIDARIDSMVYVAKPYFNRRWWGANFYKWLTESQTPYNSWGNGAAMRVSSVGWVAQSEEEVKYFSKLVTEISHNHPEGIKGAEAVAMAIYLARIGTDMKTIRQRMIGYYPRIEKMTVDNIRPGYCVDDQGGFISCQGSVPEAIVCFLEATSTEDAIRNAISLGGDADTQAAIAGSMAEAYYKGEAYETDDLLCSNRQRSSFLLSGTGRKKLLPLSSELSPRRCILFRAWRAAS